jgi:hypothetical protein
MNSETLISVRQSMLDLVKAICEFIIYNHYSDAILIELEELNQQDLLDLRLITAKYHTSIIPPYLELNQAIDLIDNYYFYFFTRQEAIEELTPYFELLKYYA